MVIDVRGPGAWPPQGSEIFSEAIVPENGALLGGERERIILPDIGGSGNEVQCPANRLAMVIDRLREALISTQGSQIDHLAIRPHHRLVKGFARSADSVVARKAHDLTLVTYPGGLAEVTGLVILKRAQVCQRTIGPLEAMRGKAVGVEAKRIGYRRAHSTHCGPIVVYQPASHPGVPGGIIGPSERAEINHLIARNCGVAGCGTEERHDD